MNSTSDIKDILNQVSEHNTDSLRHFLLDNHSKPLIAVGSGGMVGVAQAVALLYSSIAGLGRAVTPLEMNSLSDETLSGVKVLLLSAGGHNNDIEFAAKRALTVNPADTACICRHGGGRNKLQPLFEKAGASERCFIFETSAHDGFVSCGSPLVYLAILAKAFGKLGEISPVNGTGSISLVTNEGSILTPEDFRGTEHFTILSAGWGSPVAELLEGKFVESGWATADVSDYRNYCHGRFIFTSNHLEDSVVVMIVSPREEALCRRIRSFLPARTKLIIIRTELDSAAAPLDLLISATGIFKELSQASGINPDSPKNPGKIDKRVPMWVPFVAELKKAGPLNLSFSKK